MHEKNVPDADAKRTIEILKLCEVESFAVKPHINSPVLATPENHNREGIVRVTVVNDVVCIYYRKDDDLMKIFGGDKVTAVTGGSVSGIRGKSGGWMV